MPAAATSIRTSSSEGGASSSTSRISTGSPSAVIPAARILLRAPLSNPSNLEHDLAPLPGGRNPLERRPGLREREDRIDFRAKLARVHQGAQLQQLVAVGFDYEVRRAGHLLYDRDHALASGYLAATSVEDQVDLPVLHDLCAGVSH